MYLGLLGKDPANLRKAEDHWRSLGPRMLMWSQGDPTDVDKFTAEIIWSVFFLILVLYGSCRRYYSNSHIEVPDDAIVFNATLISFIYTGPHDRKSEDGDTYKSVVVFVVSIYSLLATSWTCSPMECLSARTRR